MFIMSGSEKKSIEKKYYHCKGILKYLKKVPKENRSSDEQKMVRKSCYHVARIRDLYPSLDCLKVVFACETKLLHNAKCTTANVNKMCLILLVWRRKQVTIICQVTKTKKQLAKKYKLKKKRNPIHCLL